MIDWGAFGSRLVEALVFISALAVVVLSVRQLWKTGKDDVK